MSFANRRPLIRTLRGRLTLLHLTTLALTVSLFALLAYGVLSRNLYLHHDEELGQQAEDVVAALAGRPLTESSVRQALAESSVRSRLILIRDNRGELLYREPVLDSMEPNLGVHSALVHAATTGLASPEFFTVDLERSGVTRFICAPLRQPNAYLQIGDPLGDVAAILHATAVACLPLIPVVLLLSSFGGWLMAKRALAPMRSITSTLQEIHATDLSRRIEVHPTDEELGALVSTLNHLLDRLQRAFESLRQFAGDISHQLQTPLTIMKGSLDALRRQPQRLAEGPAALDDLVREVDDISATVVDLRAFALADTPIGSAGHVDLSHLTEEAADIISALGELRGVHVTAEVDSGISVRGDSVRLKQVVLNLGDNAVKYTPEGGSVTIRLHGTATEALLEIIDTGAGISKENLPRLFDRLFRADAADRSSDGTGLGLAIAKRIVDVHNGNIDVKSRVGGGSAFTVRLPRV